MRSRSSAVACLLLTAATVAAGRGAPAPQNPPDQAPPVFRTESDFIRVDMYATRDGDFVTDLRLDEVQVFEDGVQQQLLTFEYVNIADGVPASHAEAALAGLDAPQGDPRSRVFVVFIDTHTTELLGDNALRLSLVRFLDRLLRPDDLVGLMTPDTPVSAVTLERRSTVISDLANDVRWLEEVTRERADLTEFAWESCYPSSRGRSNRFEAMKARRNAMFTIDALHDLVWHLRTLREERKAVLLVTGGWPFVGEYTLDTVPREYTRGGAETKDCADDRKALARIDYDDLLEEVTETANRANVSFYPVSSREAFRAPERVQGAALRNMRQRDTRARNAIRDQLRLLAEKTDGMANENGEFDRVASRIIADMSSYYLIGYQSTNTASDGRFRTISVKVTRPGVRVRARAGYGGATPAPRVTVAEPVPSGPPVDARVVDALTPVERFDALAPFWGRLSAWEPAGRAGGAFWFVGELGLEARTERRWRDGATAEVAVFDANKTEVLARTLDIASDQGTFMVRVPSDGSVAPGDYSVRVRLRSLGDEQVNVYDSARVTLDPEGDGLGEAVIWRQGPSVLQDYLMTADPRFRRTERLRLELPTTSQAPASARLLDRFGQPLQVPMDVRERADESHAFRWLVIEPPLAALAPAYYTIEVTQEHDSRFTAFQIIR